MDYSKGLPQRMEAFGRMLDDHEELRGRVSFLQIAPPSREAVDAYQVLREELDRLAGRINADYADLDWMPIRYLARSYDRGTLCGLYRLARVGLVTPLHDGMNLVAKEFVAAQTPDDPGVLVLSEFAGAAEQLQAALLVNPHDIAATADAIHRALSMPREERIERWQELIRDVREHDIDWWRRAFLRALEDTATRPGMSTTLDGLRLAPGDSLFLDFDGTLAEIGPDPDAITLAARRRRPPSPASPPASPAPSPSSSGRDLRDLAAPHARRASGAPAATASRSSPPAPPPPAAPPPLPEPVLAPAPRRRPHPRRPPRAQGPGRRPPLPRRARGAKPPASPPPAPRPPPRPASCTSPARWSSR